MSVKKKLGSKLAQGVRQVKTQRDAAPAERVTIPPAAATPASAQPAPVKAPVKTAPATGRVQASGTRLAQLHPRRVWPD